ncbi:MAG TPA: ATP synthase F1 subunit delta [Thermoanaerobaculia bacterium]|nr:ATP synthase F1 subunit delta [Thermoanaerobaculia bacterium]
MAGATDKQRPIARVYAEAIGALAAEQDLEDRVLEELEGLVAAVDASPELEAFLASPLVEDEAQRSALDQALRGRLSDLVVDALQVMRRKGRLVLVRAVARAYRELWMKRRHRVEVRVVSAVPLGEELRAALVETVGSRIGRQPVLVESVDAGVLGGLVVSVDDYRFDASVAARLARLQGALLERTAHELISEKSYVTNSD